MRLARGSGMLAVLTAVLLCSGAAGATTTAPPRAQLAQFSCQRALDPANRAVSVQAVMRPLTGTRHLAVRFALLERAAGSAPETIVRAGDLGAWVTPHDPTLGQLPGDVWRLNKTVLNLDAPASYQFRVTFRWTGARGRVLGTAVRSTRSCHQRELRPDLAVTAISVGPVSGNSQENLYTATMANHGLTAAGAFEVLFDPGDGSSATTRTISSLGAGQSRRLSFVGPVCDPSSPPSVTADAADQVDDFNRSNNELTAVCPATGSG